MRGAILGAGLLLAAGLLPACASTDERDVPEMRVDPGVSVLASQLVYAANLRTDTRTMRLSIQEIHENAPGMAATPMATRNDTVANALEHELTLALAGRIHLIEVELPGKSTPYRSPDGAVEAAERLGVTHFLVGDYQRHGDKLILSFRLVDADTHEIVAAVRGTVPRKAYENPASKRWSGKGIPVAAAPVPADGGTEGALLADSSPSSDTFALDLPPADGPVPPAASAPVAERSLQQVPPEAVITNPIPQAELARLLGAPSAPGATRVGIRSPRSAMRSDEFPWRTRTLAELLGVKAKGD